ncbi:MAG TPA: hypothetical protein VK879_05615 [Candidatus Sulfomarinibacteraceae bacterium]|nr:hypothetical protein [Candidatus Sulfomarinibacteraceae bacterium]
MKLEHQDTYIAYLLRLWKEEGQSEWRASLENPRNGQKHYFTSLEALFNYVVKELDDASSRVIIISE